MSLVVTHYGASVGVERTGGESSMVSTVSEGCKTGPLVGSPVLNGVVGAKGERREWVGSREVK